MLHDEKIIRLLTKPLEKYFKQKDIVEIIAVKGDYLGLQRHDKPWEVVHDPECSFDFWQRLCNVISNSKGVFFDEDKQPKLSAVLPDNHRIEAMIGNNVDTKLSISIRVKRNIVFELSDFGLSEFEANKLIYRLQNGENIIISAPTNGGKTSLVNTFLQYINGKKAKTNIRILTIEDAREIDLQNTSICPQYIVSRNETDASIGYNEMINHTVRANPSYIILGEISVENAYPATRLLNTGHKGFLTTIHANSAIDALDGAFVQNVEMAGLQSKNISKWLHSYVGIVIQLKARKVVEIFYPEKDKLGEMAKFPENEPQIQPMPLELVQDVKQIKRTLYANN